MAVGDACKRAIERLVGRRYADVFSNEDEICVEVSSLANEAARDICESHDWRKLRVKHVITGDGETSVFPLPSNYSRMVTGAGVHSGTWYNRRYVYAGSLDNWEDLEQLKPAIPPGYWMLQPDGMSFLPVISSGDTASFYYIRKDYAVDAGGSPKTEFTQDSDSFRVDDRLLTLSLIWRWKLMKGMDAEADLQLYNTALGQEKARDGGSRSIRAVGYGSPFSTSIAYPWPLGGA